MSIRQHSLTAATALAIVAVGWTLFQARGDRPKLSLPRPAAITRPARVALPPTARDILGNGLLLDLTGAQETRLRALDATWTREVTAIQAQLDAATADFARFMDEARGRGRISMPEIQQHAAEISELSAELRERRRIHAEAAAAILTEWQRSRLGGVSGAVIAGGER